MTTFVYVVIAGICIAIFVAAAAIRLIDYGIGYAIGRALNW